LLVCPVALPLARCRGALMAFADWTCEPVKLTFVSETVAFFI
jgi:hypothetical protein